MFCFPKRIASAKACSSHYCKVNMFGKLAHDFYICFSRFLGGTL